MTKPEADKVALNALIPVGHDVYQAIATLRRRKRVLSRTGCTTLPSTYWPDLKPKARPGDVVEIAVGGRTVERLLVLGQGARLLPDLAELGTLPVIGTVTERQVPAALRSRVFG